jgi:glycosyltransferase involved in cell wall biosynthesis
MDGLEWQRAKYSKPVRRFLKFAEKLAIKSSSFHVADSPVIKEYLDGRYHINSKYIAYGANLSPLTDENLLDEYNLRKNEYFLLMARMEPENNIEMILDGYCKTPSTNTFVVIGNTGNGFGSYLVEKYKNEKRIVFLGAIFNEWKVQTLTSYCKLYFHGHSVGGTNPSLLNAMAAQAPIAIHDNPFNKSLVKNNALVFSNTKEISDIVNSGEYLNEVHIQNNYATVKNHFSWDQIINNYEQYFIACYRSANAFYPIKHEESILFK